MTVQMNEVTIILMSLSIMLISGFLMTRVTKPLKLPNVTAYIISGILIGPYFLKLIPIDMVDSMSFVGDIALAFIAFDVGKFLKKEVFIRSGVASIIITLFESLVAGAVITLAMRFLFKLEWDFSLLLGAIATATAPASTMMTINQYKAKGEFVDILLQVVALDDMVCLITFSLVATFINANKAGGFLLSDALLPILHNLGALIIGFVFGLILGKILTPTRSDDNRLILTIAMLLGLSALASMFDISPLLSCMVFGITYINTTEDKKLYTQINHFTPPILSLFFIMSGIKLDVSSLSTLGIIGVGYFFIRIIGKYVGSYVGCYLTGKGKNVCNYLGFALVPSAGVAIGLAFLGYRILPPDMGNRLLTIILSSAVLYELIGPASAKFALFYSGAIKKS
ncbi:MAG: cation:proton antiporter [Tissierellaceae bacterium]|nr:cation:proton antiporter [Tissierellaceae bacterium]